MFVLGTFGWYAFTKKNDVAPLSSTPTPTSEPTAPIVTPDVTPKVSELSSSTSTPPPKSLGQYKDGSYTGDSVDIYYGYIQVKATISGGKLTDVTILNYPNDRGHSVRINEYALPLLKDEAISIQSASVDVISGATATSTGFQKSLATALIKAK